VVNFLSCCRQIKVPALRAIVLFLAGLRNEFARFLRFLVEPMSDVGPCRFDQWTHLFNVDIFLDQLCEIVNLMEKCHPKIIGLVVLGQFR
jgi:hypothetical protein